MDVGMQGDEGSVSQGPDYRGDAGNHNSTAGVQPRASVSGNRERPERGKSQEAVDHTARKPQMQVSACSRIYLIKNGYVG